MSKADEWYDEYSTTKRFSTQNTDERNKRYQRKSDEWYDKYSTTRRFESSIQYADDEEEKKENKPVIQPDTSVKPQQQTNTQTNTQTQTQNQVQAPAQNQFQPNTQMQKPSQTQVQDSSAVKNYLNGYTPTVTVQNQINGMTGYNKETKKFDNESYKSIAKNTFDNMLKQGALTNKDYVYLTEYFGMPQDKVEIPQIKQVYSYDPLKADVKKTAIKDGGDTVNSQYIYHTPNMSRNSADDELFKQYLNDYQKQVESINQSTQDDSIKDSYLEEARLQYEINLLSQRERIEESSNKSVPKNDNSAFVTPSATRNRELTLSTSQNQTKTKTQTLLEEKKKRLNTIKTQNKLNRILENEEVSSLVGALHDDEVDKETTVLNSLLNPSYAESKTWSTAINSAMGNESTASKAYNARQKLIEMGYNPDELLEQYSRNKSRVLTEALTQSAVEFGKEHPVLGTALSFPAMFASGAGMIETAKATLTGRDVDPNSPYFAALNVAQGLRGGVSSELSSGGEVAYMIGTTIGDMVVTKLGSFGSDFGYAAVMASQAAASTAQEGAQKGYSTEHILINSLTSAALTAVCEKIGYDKVFSAQKATSSKELFGNILRGFLAEGLEEASEETLNTLTENITSLVFNGETETLARVKELMARGMSREDAEAQAIFEIVGRVGQSYIAGGFSGGIISGVTSSKNYVANRISNLLSKNQTNDAEIPAVNTENEQKTPLNSSAAANDETVDTPKQNAVTGQNIGYANEFDNLYDEDVFEEFKQPAEEVDTTVDENGVEWLDFDDDTDFEAVDEELKSEYNAEETAGLTEKVEPYTSGNTSVDALINPNGRLDRKITINEQAQQRITDIAQRFFGRKVRFVDDISNADGFFDKETGEIVLSKTSSMKELTLFGHEFGHTLEGTNEYRYLTTHLRYNSQYIKSQLAKVNNSWDELVQQKVNDYQDSLGKTLTKSQAEFEIYADAIANELFTDYKAIEVLATQNQSLFTRLKQWFYRNVIKTSEQTTVLGTKAAQRKTYALMLKAEKAAMNKASGEGVVTPTETVVFEPTQIKSATDNIGTFDKNNPDIRYSAKQSEAAQRITENFGYTDATANNIVKAARSLKQKADSKADLNELAYTIAQTLEDRRNGNTNGRDAERIAMMLAENAEAINEDFVAEYKPIIDRLNGMTISISEADTSDLGDAFSYVKKRLFPYVTLTKGEGTRVDSIFQDLAKDYPMVFNAETVTHPGDQVRAIMGFIEDYRNNRYFKPYFESDEAFANLREDVETLLGDKTLDENTYLNKLSQLVEKYGEIKNGVPQSTDGKTRVRGAIASFYGTKPIISNPELSERYAKDIVNGKYDYTVMRIGKEAKQYLDNIKSSENVTEKVINEYGRLKDLLTNKNHRLTPTDIMQACALNPLLGEVLTDDAYVDYTSIVSEVATETGQMVSCFRILSEFSGAQKLKAYQKKLDQINAERSKNYQGAPDYNAVADENGQFKMADESLSEGKSPKNKTPKGFIELAVAKKGSKYPPIEIPIELQEELVKAKGKAEIDLATDKINKYLAQQVHPTWFDKFNAWRYFSMLSNPKTAIRNTVGNVAMGTIARIKDVVAATLSLLPSKYKNDAVQTVSVTTTKEARKAATRLLTESDNVFSFFSNQDKYTGRTNEFEKSEVKLNKLEKKIAEKNPLLDTIFHKREIQPSAMASTGRNVIDKPLGKLSDIQQKALDDTLFKVLRAKSVLAQSITQAVKKGDIENLDDFLAVALNGNTEHIDNATKIHYQQLFDIISRQAAKEGDEATFRENNEFANALNNFAKGNSKVKRALSIGVEAIIPFKKTPANILKRGYEYSPIALGINLVSGRVKLAKGEIDRNAYINEIAKSLTGTGIFAAGALLSAIGVLDVGDDDEEEKAERELRGGQQYAIKVGDGSYTIDFLSPAALPLFMGGKVYEGIVSAFNGDEIKATEFAFDILQGVAEPMFAQTMLDGIDGAFEAISRESAYSDEEGATFVALLNYCVENWVNQFVPSVLGAVARTADDTVRGYFTEKGKKEGILQDLMVGIQKKAPGIASKTPAKLDMWGQPIKSGNLSERLIENFISPGYYEKNTEDEATLALHEFADDNDIPYTEILPKEVPKYFTAPNGDRINLTAEEYEIYAGIIGKARKEAVEKYLIDGDNAEIKYTCKVIKPKNKSGTGEEDYVFKGNINEAKNTKSWGKVVKNNDGTPTKIDVSSDEDFRAMLYKKLMEQVTEDAKAEVEQKILKKRK